MGGASLTEGPVTYEVNLVPDPAIEDEVVRLMAAVIVAVCGKGVEQDHDDDEPSGHREDHD